MYMNDKSYALLRQLHQLANNDTLLVEDALRYTQNNDGVSDIKNVVEYIFKNRKGSQIDGTRM